MNKIDLRVDWATYEAAKYACQRWHYSKSVPCNKLVKIGAWENGVFIGVVIFGCGATPNLAKPYNLNQNECVELVRIALKKHATPVSKIVSIAIKKLKKTNPLLKLIVSFADQSQNHHGGIYQAGNWTYNGKSNPATFYEINGKKTHPRTIGAAGYIQNIDGARKIDKFAKTIKVPGKHRYLMPLTKEMRKQIEPLSKPYPKRVKQAITDDQSEAAVQHRPTRSKE